MSDGVVNTELEPDLENPQVVLQKLSARHKNVASLLSQGTPRLMIAKICSYTPEYITMLQRQPLFIQYVKEMNVAVGTQLEALFGRTVDVIQETLENGNAEEKLKAAKLQMEATDRIGRNRYRAPQEGGEDRLENLADRLVGLLERKRSSANGRVFEEAEIVSESQRPLSGMQGSGEVRRPQSSSGESLVPAV